MPRRKSLLTVIRDLVQEEVGTAIGSFLGTGKPKAKNGRRRRRKARGKWRPGGPGRPPKAVAEKTAKSTPASPKAKNGRRNRRRVRRPASSKTKAA
jgi:hypothetical protein